MKNGRGSEEMEELVQQAIKDITYRSENFPEEPFRIICENKEAAVPYLRAAIEKAVSERDDLDEDYQLHFYALHLLAQFQEKTCFPQIMEMASLPCEVIDYLIGDTITSSLPDVLYNTYNGDFESLKRAVKDPDIDDYVRGSMLKAMGQLFLDGNLNTEEWKEFIRGIVYEEDEIGDFIYTELASVICECHMVDMLPEIRRLYDDRRIDESCIGEYDSCVDTMFRYEDYICKAPVNAADMLRGWDMFEQGPQKEWSEKDLKKLLRAEMADSTEHKIKIGRNDPCPCGSGKKYKKCCLNKTQTPVDLIESVQEKEKWLRYYPAALKEREEGRIYLEDYFDPDSIEIDKLIYLALNYRDHSIWDREPEEAEEKRKRVYLSEAFSKFTKKIEKENINKFQEYDEKFSIHYQCAEWFEPLLRLLKKAGEDAAYKEVLEFRRKMR